MNLSVKNAINLPTMLVIRDTINIMKIKFKNSLVMMMLIVSSLRSYIPNEVVMRINNNPEIVL